jgi:23S rRNA (cytosine1962-C5)-methyltransferase
LTDSEAATRAGSEPGIARLRLAPGRERALVDGHPWLFSGAVAAESGPADAPLARVETADGRALGLAFYSPRSRIRARLLGRAVERVDRAFFAARLERALELRRAVVGADSDGYRVLNAEGDGVPGWTVDRFGPVLVSQMTVVGLDRLRDEAYAALGERFPDHAILHLGDLAARREEGLATDDVAVAGAPPAEVEFRENGLRVVAELATGQKTGWYCDQRDNRRLAGRLAAGRRLLDLFAHSGGFALNALASGGRAATLVESSPRLVAAARRALAANGLAEAAVELVEADVFAHLRSESGRYGLVVCDPPPLARRRDDVDAAARAYKDLNRLALGRLEPGGFLLTFSCSGAVDAKLFRQILFAAAVEAGTRLELLAPLAAAPDHPVDVAHLQGEYLKGWLARSAGPR